MCSSAMILITLHVVVDDDVGVVVAVDVDDDDDVADELCDVENTMSMARNTDTCTLTNKSPYRYCLSM